MVTVSCRVKNGKFQPQKLPIDISEKNETEATHWINFGASSTVNRKSVTSVAMTTMTYQNGRKCTFNPIYFANELVTPDFFALKPFITFK